MWKPVPLRPRVVNHSKTETVDAAISILIDGKEISRPALTLKPGESATREIVYTPMEPGVLRGRFEVEETGDRSDRFPDDDSFLFTLTVSPQIKVVLVNGAPATDPYENETLFLKTALTVGADDESSAAEIARLRPDFGRLGPPHAAKTEQVAQLSARRDRHAAPSGP